VASPAQPRSRRVQIIIKPSVQPKDVATETMEPRVVTAMKSVPQRSTDFIATGSLVLVIGCGSAAL
jgi:hypothetical protein